MIDTVDTKVAETLDPRRNELHRQRRKFSTVDTISTDHPWFKPEPVDRATIILLRKDRISGTTGGVSEWVLVPCRRPLEREEFSGTTLILLDPGLGRWKTGTAVR